MSRVRFSILLLVLALTACARPATMETPASSPASPNATEAPAPSATQGIAPGVSGAPSAAPAPQHSMDHMNMPMDSGTAGGAGTTQSAPSEVIYTCPMHPQIVRAEPGQCPICGMTLAPRKK